MSDHGINLLHDQHKSKAITPILKRLFILRLISTFILFGVGLFSVVLSVFITLSPLPQLQEEEANLKTQLEYYNLDINKLAFINERANYIRGIIQKRSQPERKLALIQEKIPSGVTLEEIILNNKTYTIKFSSTNLSLLDELTNSISGLTGPGKQFSRLFFTSITSSSLDQKFVMTLDLLAI